MKFSPTLPLDKGANLLSSLIDEPVTTDDLLSLFHKGWIHLVLHCYAEIIKLKPTPAAGSHNGYAGNQTYLEEAEDYASSGICLAFYLPCAHVNVNGRAVYALRDADSNLYALRDIETDDYLSEPAKEPQSKTEKVSVSTFEIYDIAIKTNTNSMPCRSELKEAGSIPRTDSGKELHSTTPVELFGPTQTAPTIIPDKTPPSLRITVAALLEAATSKPAKHTQASLISSILDKNSGIRGLSESSLQKHFNESNKALAAQRASSQD